MKIIILFLLVIISLLSFINEVNAFVSTSQKRSVRPKNNFPLLKKQHKSINSDNKKFSTTSQFYSVIYDDDDKIEERNHNNNIGFHHVAKVGAAAMISSWLFSINRVLAEVVVDPDEIEIQELPPVYIPVLFGIALLVGVGALTGSLGNVIDEEASLGLQSGARAKKEMERSRSSYFKK